MKKIKYIASTVVLTLAISLSAQAQVADFGNLKNASTALSNPFQQVQQEKSKSTTQAAKPKKKNSLAKTRWWAVDGNQNIQLEVKALVTDDGYGPDIMLKLYKKGWVLFGEMRYTKTYLDPKTRPAINRWTGLVGLRRNFSRNAEAKLVFSGEVAIGGGSQIGGIRSDINLNNKNVEGNLEHIYLTPKPGFQVEAGLNMEWKIAPVLSIFLSGGAMYRTGEGKKLSMDSDINLDGATVQQGKPNLNTKALGYRGAVGISIVF